MPWAAPAANVYPFGYDISPPVITEPPALLPDLTPNPDYLDNNSPLPKTALFYL